LALTVQSNEFNKDKVNDKVPEVEDLKQMADLQKWVHMNDIETEKLEWMKDCPPPSAIKKQVNLLILFPHLNKRRISLSSIIQQRRHLLLYPVLRT